MTEAQADHDMGALKDRTVPDLACLASSAFSEPHRQAYRRQGYVMIEDGLAEGLAERILGDLEGHRYLKVESPAGRSGVTTFLSKNGARLFEASPVIETLEREMVALTEYVSGIEYAALDNREIGASANITPPGGGFGTHFDRQEVSAVIYLNTVAGGTLDLWPRLRRWEIPWLGVTAQRATMAMTRLLPPVRLSPRKGSLLLFTRESPHRVAEVEGTHPRVSIVFGLDRPGKSFREGQTYYGYAEETVSVSSLR